MMHLPHIRICMAGIESCVWQEWIESCSVLSVGSWGQVFNVCGRLTWDIKRSRSKRRERERLREEQHFPTAGLQVTYSSYRSPPLSTLLFGQHVRKDPHHTACLVTAPVPYVRTYNNPSFACRPYIHTSLDFVWILCIHPSTREGTMKSTGFLQARCHPSLNASTACTGTAITEPCSCL